MILEKNILKMLCLLLFAGVITGCDGSDDTDRLQNITLSADKNNLKSDGNETITFSVKGHDKDVTHQAQIIYKEENTPLSGYRFSTNISGTYTFYATYEGIKSTDIQIHAMPIVLILTADTTCIKANGKSTVTFSATADGETITDRIELFLVNEASDILLENNVFNTEQEGSYELYCKYNDQISNKITITAIPFILQLKADTSSIKANGNESVTFAVTADDENITAEGKIYRKDGDQAIPLESNTFATTQEGNYEFFAQYRNQTSNSVWVEAIVSKLSLTADATSIKTGESVTFTAISDNENNVSADIDLHITVGDKKETLKGNVFTPSSFGTYTVYASFEGRTSNSINIEVSPATITLSADQTTLKSTGADAAVFTVYVDGIVYENADIYMKGETKDTKIENSRFVSNLQGTYAFYAQFEDLQSEEIRITVNFVNFVKQSCAIGVFATWCGYSPSMINVFHEVQNAYPDKIQIVSVHRSSSLLGSSDFNAEEYILLYNQSEEVPFGLMDLDYKLLRNVTSIYNSYQHMQYTHPVKSGIAIESKITDGSIDVKLKVKVNETNEYRICAMIVEDNIVKRQNINTGSSSDDYIRDETFVHNSVATYIMPGTNLYTGRSLGTVQAGNEVLESFSIPTDKVVTNSRTVNHANCRVVAYVLMKEGNQFYINNVTTCSINGSVDYKYRE